MLQNQNTNTVEEFIQEFIVNIFDFNERDNFFIKVTEDSILEDFIILSKFVGDKKIIELSDYKEQWSKHIIKQVESKYGIKIYTTNINVLDLVEYINYVQKNRVLH